MLVISIITGAIYFGLIAAFFYGWEKLSVPTSTLPNTKVSVSVIVAMRNEEQNISRLISCLLKQDYPQHLIEIIIIDDHSTDLSIRNVLDFENDRIKVLMLPDGETGKKAAIRMGLQHASGDLLLFTDADCLMGSQWVSALVCCYVNYKPVMILAPVCGIYHNTFSKMQALEMLSLQGSTAGSAAIGHPTMCNAANMAISRDAMPEILHIYNNKQIFSGDDMFALLALKHHHPKGIYYLKSKIASVRTSLPETITAFMAQRKRWAAKARFYNDAWVLFTAFVVFATNFVLIMTCLYGIGSGVFIPFCTLFIIKAVIDFAFLWRLSAFTDEQKLMIWFPIVESIYSVYVVSTAFSGMFWSFQWKGRRIKY